MLVMRGLARTALSPTSLAGLQPARDPYDANCLTIGLKVYSGGVSALSVLVSLSFGYSTGVSDLPEIAAQRRSSVKKLMILVAMLAMVLVVAAPAMAAQEKMDEKMKMEEKEKKGKEKEKKKEEMPKTGGAPINAALLGLGGATLLIGGGLLVRKVTR